MYLSAEAVAIALPTLQFGAVRGQQLKPMILADTNRDGIVDDSDATDRAFWTSSRGAIFLPNVGDSLNRCPNQDLQGNPLSNHELASCHDASGHLLIELSLVAPLKTIPLEVSNDTIAHIYATPDAAFERVHLFYMNDSFVDPEFTFNASHVQAGITLGIDGREFLKDLTRWDGKVRVHFDVHTNSTIISDAVELRVAPVLTHHHLQRYSAFVSTAANESDPIQLGFSGQLDEVRKAAGIQEPLYLFNQSDDIWAQDFVEPAYASMPGPNGQPISLRIMLRSAQSVRAAGRQVFEQLRGKGVGGFQPEGGRGGYGDREINAYGNLETIPPYTSKSGVKYPACRIIHGKHYDKMPTEATVAFLEGQELQNPLFLESGWLLIGHVDEFVQFLPSNETGLGFTIGITDTTSALDLLRNTSAAGHVGVRAISFNGSVESSSSITIEELTMTIDEHLANEIFHEVNAYAQRHIDANLGILLAEIPILRDHVIRIPSLFKAPKVSSLSSFTETVTNGEYLLVSFSPAAINGVVLGNYYVSPKTWGPVVEGQDILEVAIREAYAKAGMEVRFVDDFMSHHHTFGEVHCGSNTFRETDVAWWE
ncbi:Protein-arginine deiminase type-4 [Colletotrichum aenigma]|uniref:Protein-arginine deiminase type-4 n=1 Tax=Colletotrichum aenigma TaxID=1215731 RepID=UPI00187305C3|nr:Protein-arginine deiminase type-4 [Colletotrichum aenigma]KAF5520476.1 Protein-arginine deiminase type-4 [Colletotrichum aenigma]